MFSFHAWVIRMIFMMENELKETLLKVADYNELERKRAAEAGSLSFRIMFLVCAVTIVVQMLMDGSFPMIIGETIVLLAGGLIYIFFAVKNGAWNGTVIKGTPKKDFMISLICVGIFSIVFYMIMRKHVAALQAVGLSVCFFAILSLVSYVLLRGFACFSQKQSDKWKDGNVRNNWSGIWEPCSMIETGPGNDRFARQKKITGPGSEPPCFVINCYQ